MDKDQQHRIIQKEKYMYIYTTCLQNIPQMNYPYHILKFVLVLHFTDKLKSQLKP